MKLRDYCKFITKGLNFSKGETKVNMITDFYEPAIYSNNNAWYYITMSCIKDNYIEKVYMFEENRDYLKYALRDGDIVLCKLGPYFRTAIYDNAFPFAKPKEVTSKVSIVVTENIYIIGLDKEKVDPYYIAYILSLPETKEYFKSVAKGSKTKVLNINDALELDIPEFTKEMRYKTENFIDELLAIGNKYKTYQDSIKELVNDKIEDAIRKAKEKLDEALKSGDINKMKEAVGNMGLAIHVPDSKWNDFKKNENE